MEAPGLIVVHLARHGDRRRRLAAQFRRHGFGDVFWLDAVDGTRLDAAPPWQADGLPPVRPWPAWADPYARRALTLGEVGCSLSHVAAWRRIVQHGRPAIVLEDDAELIAPLMPDLPRLLDDLDCLDFDLCYLAQRNAPGPKPLLGRLVHLVDYHPVWTLAYLLSPAGAEKLLASPWQTHLVPADELMPAVFGLNRNPDINRLYLQPGGGLVAASNQRFFTPAEGSQGSETEKSLPICEPGETLSAFTVATHRCPELQRLLDSGRRYGVAIQPLGLGSPWRGGEMAAGAGGGQKINLLRPALRALPAQRPVLFVDGYDTLISGHVADILSAWEREAEKAPLFAAEVYCWPDADRAGEYPQTDTPYRFLNSGAFIGRAGALLRIIEADIADHEDDQRYYTERFLSDEYGIRLDAGCGLFQCVHGAQEDLCPDEGRGMLYNRRTESWPAVIHANGPSKPWLEQEGRAVGGRWRRYYGDMP